MSRPGVRGCLGWLCFLALLGALSVLLWSWLPPEPRWLIDSDGFPLALVEYHRRPVVVLQAGRQLSGKNFEHFGPVRLWDLDLGREIPSFFNNATVHAVWNPNKDGRFLFCELDGGNVGLVDFQHEREVRLELNTRGLQVQRLSADGRYLAVQDKGNLQLFETATGRRIEEFAGMVHGCDFDPSSRFLRVALQKETPFSIDIWRLEGRKVVKTFHGLADDVVFSPDGNRLCAAHVGKDGFAAWTVWDTATWEPVLALGCHPLNHGVRFSPDGKVVVGWFEDERGVSWLDFWDSATGRKLGMASTASNVELVAFSPDSREVVTLATTLRDRQETILACFNYQTGEQLWERKSRSHWRSWHPIHTTSNVGVWPGVEQVELVDPHTGKTIRTIAIPNMRYLWWVSPKGDLLVVGRSIPPDPNEDRDGIWESIRKLLLPKQNRRQTEHYLALYDVKNGRELARLADDSNPSQYLFNDAKHLITRVTSESAPIIRVWDIPPPKPWRYIVGGPAALGFLILAWRYWRSRRKARRPAVANPT
ncbi:MAG: hypothetical protein L0215_04535 [Gemmataceae bacterium]|nr:hypothetical protein [Gemmataceae bacterium]